MSYVLLVIFVLFSPILYGIEANDLIEQHMNHLKFVILENLPGIQSVFIGIHAAPQGGNT